MDYSLPLFPGVSTLKKIAAILGCFLLLACAGRGARPVKVVQPGDEERSCQSIRRELRQIEGEIRKLTRTTKKVAPTGMVGKAGARVMRSESSNVNGAGFPPVVKGLAYKPKSPSGSAGTAEEQELRAYRKRFNHLQDLYLRKNCGEYESVWEQPNVEAEGNTK